jgi:CheY-like chemotaxis protein
MAGGGRIVVAVGAATLDAERSGGTAGEYGYFAVTDSGVGMDAETRARLFEPFFTTKGEGFGSGLGMAMVADLVRLQHGVIEVDSAAGRGTTVTVYLRRAPAGTAAEPAAPAEAPAARRRGTETILIVEDEDAIRNSARRLLERQGYRVLEARDGADGLAVYRRHAGQVALVLSDVVMPGMTGPELCQAIGGGVKFLLMTGYTAGEPWAGIKPEPMPPVLHKPFLADELLTLVRATLDGSDQ